MEIAVNGAVYTEVRKGMHGLPQAGRIANNELVPHVEKHGYHQSKRIPGLFKHETRPVWFALVVDDFGVKCVGKENAEHLRDILKSKYKITEDWSGKTFCGLNLTWDYDNGTVDIDMPDYVKNALQQFEHTQTKNEHSPHEWRNTSAIDNTPPCSLAEQKRIYQVVGKFLYYGRAVDNTMLTAVSSIASAQSKGTEATVDAITCLLNYAATHPNAKIRYRASQMALHVHSDGSYLTEPKSRSRAANYFYLTDHPDNTPPAGNPPNNGPILVVTNIIKPVVSAAYEAEVAAAFQAGQEGCAIRTTLEFLGHPQPPTPIITDNKVCQSILNDTCKQRKSKAMDMRYYWPQDRINQKQCSIHWKPGKDNKADYHSKHHAPAQHKHMRPVYLYEPGAQYI